MMVHHFLCTIKEQGAKEEGKKLKEALRKKRRALVQNRDDFGWWASSL